eukprot:460408-Rhodomonas_salina.1
MLGTDILAGCTAARSVRSVALTCRICCQSTEPVPDLSLHEVAQRTCSGSYLAAPPLCSLRS